MDFASKVAKSHVLGGDRCGKITQIPLRAQLFNDKKLAWRRVDRRTASMDDAPHRVHVGSLEIALGAGVKYSSTR